MSKFKKVNVAGDGACYFHAVVGFQDMERLVKDKKTYYKKGLDKEASDLRKKVVTWLRNNLTFQYENGLTIQDDIEDEIRNNPKIQSVNDYLRDMSRPSAYAGQIEITATANILKRNIRVFVKKQGRYRNVGLGYEINQSKDKDITLFHNMGTSKGSGKHHFEILFPTSKAQVVTKTNYDTLKSKVKYKMKRTRRANKRTKRVKRVKRVKRTKRTQVKRKTVKRKTMKRSKTKERHMGGKPDPPIKNYKGIDRKQSKLGHRLLQEVSQYTVKDSWSEEGGRVFSPPIECNTCGGKEFIDRYTTMATSKFRILSRLKQASLLDKKFKLLECVKCSRVQFYTNYDEGLGNIGQKIIKIPSVTTVTPGPAAGP